LLNVTNDGWFGQTTGPHQHLHQARVRAVEEGLPIVRAANNGISALIDARGRIISSLGLDVRGTIDGALPPALAQPVYARYEDWVFLLLFAGLGGCWIAGRVWGSRTPWPMRVN
jgi:apolipoprotein N-acyltransferase